LARALASEVEKYLVVSTRKKLAVICYCKCWLLKLAANAGRGQKLAILADLFGGLTPVRTSSRSVPSPHAKLFRSLVFLLDMLREAPAEWLG